MFENTLSLNSYFKDISKIPLICGEEQKKLAVKAQSGDKRSMDKLVNCNLRFVIFIAKEYQHKDIEFEDLVNEGNIGLIKAVKKYDITKNVMFITYAVWWIRQSILQAIYENENIVRLPVNRINIKNKINRANDALFEDLKRLPTVQEISEFSSVSETDINGYFTDCNLGIKLESKISENSEETFESSLEGDGYDKMEKIINKKDVSFEINQVLSKLSEREKKVLNLYYGLEDGCEMNLKEVGYELNLTNERVRQIKKFALKKLRTYQNSKQLKDLLSYNI